MSKIIFDFNQEKWEQCVLIDDEGKEHYIPCFKLELSTPFEYSKIERWGTVQRRKELHKEFLQWDNERNFDVVNVEIPLIDKKKPKKPKTPPAKR